MTFPGAIPSISNKEADGKLDEEKLKGLVRALAYCPLMVKAKQGKSAFNRPLHLVQALLMLTESLVFAWVCTLLQGSIGIPS